MSSLRAFRFQKAKPATSSPSSTASEVVPQASSPISSPADSQSPEPKNGKDSAKLDEDSSDDIIKPPVSWTLKQKLPLL